MATGSSWLFKASSRCLLHFFFFFFFFIRQDTLSLAQLLFWSPPTLLERIKIAALRLFPNMYPAACRGLVTPVAHSWCVRPQDSRPRCRKYCGKEHFESVKTDEIWDSSFSLSVNQPHLSSTFSQMIPPPDTISSAASLFHIRCDKFFSVLVRAGGTGLSCDTGDLRYGSFRNFSFENDLSQLGTKSVWNTQCWTEPHFSKDSRVSLGSGHPPAPSSSLQLEVASQNQSFHWLATTLLS